VATPDWLRYIAVSKPMPPQPMIATFAPTGALSRKTCREWGIDTSLQTAGGLRPEGPQLSQSPRQIVMLQAEPFARFARFALQHHNLSRALTQLRAFRTQPSRRLQIVMLQRKASKPGEGLGKTTGWIHRATLLARGVDNHMIHRQQLAFTADSHM
jgi:hypothetical protein